MISHQWTVFVLLLFCFSTKKTFGQNWAINKLLPSDYDKLKIPLKDQQNNGTL